MAMAAAITIAITKHPLSLDREKRYGITQNQNIRCAYLHSLIAKTKDDFSGNESLSALNEATNESIDRIAIHSK